MASCKDDFLCTLLVVLGWLESLGCLGWLIVLGWLGSLAWLGWLWWWAWEVEVTRLEWKERPGPVRYIWRLKWLSWLGYFFNLCLSIMCDLYNCVNLDDWMFGMDAMTRMTTITTMTRMITKWSEVKWCLYSKRVNRRQLWSKLINLWPFINIKSTLINHPRSIFNLRLFTIIQIWHHFKAETLWYFLTLTFPVNFLSINFAQLIVNLENNYYGIGFCP